MALEGSPGIGGVLWASVTLPPNTVAHELKELIKVKAMRVLNRIFFIYELIKLRCKIQEFLKNNQ